MRPKASFNTALVTGATSGLGKGLAQFLSKKGIEVIGVGSSDYNLSDSNQLTSLLDLISEKKPDLIINNAGLGYYGPALSPPLEDQMEMIKVNVEALTAITLHCAKTLSEAGKRGTILNISSAAAFTPFPTFSVYAASKSYVNTFSQGLDLELKPNGIRVLCACPGQIATDFQSRAGRRHPQKKDRGTMSIERAISHLWKQIEEGKGLYIFDWKTRVLLSLSKLLSPAKLGEFLSKAIADRY